MFPDNDIGNFCRISEDCQIGKHNYFNDNVRITRARIGNYCSFGRNVTIGPGEHDLERISTSSRFYDEARDELTAEKVTLGNDVWVGLNSVVLRGVQIGDGVVIGANAVVTKDIPSFAVAVGSPARVLRFRFGPEQVEGIAQSKWWDHSPETARQKIELLEKSFQ